MRALPVLKKQVLPKLKLSLPPAKSPFRSHLAPPPAPAATTPAPRTATETERPGRPHHQAANESERTPPKRREPLDELDSAARNAVLLAPPPQPHQSIAAPPKPATPPPIDPQHALAVVEQAALWGDGTRGVARLRFNNRARAGLANATVTLEHDGETVRLRVDGIDHLSEDLRERLAARGVELGES